MSGALVSIEAPLGDYASPDRREAELERAAALAGAEIVVLGESVEGRPIRAARVPSLQPTSQSVLLSANIHGVEWIGARTALAFLSALSSDVLSPLRARAEVWVLPCINPDGYQRTWSARGVGSLKTLRTNSHGVDLNRNFPLPFGAKPLPLAVAGSSDPSRATYRGGAPLSEPEALALEELFRRVHFIASANLHCFMGTLLPPPVKSSADFDGYRRLCRAFQRGQGAVKYRRVASRLFDVFTGEQEDHQHHVHNTWATCVEIFPVTASIKQHLRAPSLFWRFNPHVPDFWIQNDIPGLAAYFLEALEMGPPAR